MKKFLSVLVGVSALLAFFSIMVSSIQASHGSVLHNATRMNAGSWYGSMATINWTNPNLRTGQWTYVRTATPHQNPGTCFRFTENGWYKTTSGLKGLVVWDNGCNRQELQYNITAAQHTFSQQYYQSGSQDRYNWYVDGSSIGNGLTNFSYGTSVFCGGETATGVEAMGNTLCAANKKLNKNANGTYSFISWGGHSNYATDAPYSNVNHATDPNNAFYSKGNE